MDEVILQKIVENVIAEQAATTTEDVVGWFILAIIAALISMLIAGGWRFIKSVHDGQIKNKELLLWLKEAHLDPTSDFATTGLFPPIEKLLALTETLVEEQRWMNTALEALMRKDGMTDTEMILLRKPDGK